MIATNCTVYTSQQWPRIAEDATTASKQGVYCGSGGSDSRCQRHSRQWQDGGHI